MNEKKTVSFSSTPLERSKNIISTPDCIEYMRNGSDLIKLLANGRQYKRTYYLDWDTNDIRWYPTNKKKYKAKITIDEIREIRRGIGKCAETSLSECSFTIVYGLDFELLCLIANTAEEANVWISGLSGLVLTNRTQKALLTGSCNSSSPVVYTNLIGPQAIEDSEIEKNQSRDKWLQDMFSGADCENKGFLDEMCVIQLMKSVNSGVATVRIKQKLKEVDLTRSSERGRLTSDEFVNLFKEIFTRPEIFFLLVRYSSNGEFLSVDDLLLFLEAEQGLTGVTREQCSNLIQKYEPSPDGKQKDQLGIDGFTAYLTSPHCDIFDPDNLSVCQDMTQPLPHYFISASYNTYLMEDQLKGPSSINGYIRALTVGCRFIKMDVWDGPNDEPIIYHGDTLTSKLGIRKTLENIYKYAFIVSEYPLLIGLENHCSLRQQFTLTSLLRLVFNSTLYIHDPSVESDWPSPGDLRNRIVLIGKKLVNEECKKINESDIATGVEDEKKEVVGDESNTQFGYISEENDDFDCSRHKLSRYRKSSNSHKIKLMKPLSDLMFLNLQRFDETQLDNVSMNNSQILKKSPSLNLNERSGVYLMSEGHAIKLATSQGHALTSYNRNHLTMIYPNISRVDSSNYNPHDLWNCGCQLVTLNYQTVGMVMDLQAGFFMRNGSCGYVLKPDVMRHQLLLDMTATRSRNDPSGPGNSSVLSSLSDGAESQLLHVRVISAQQLPKPRGSTAKGSVLDPYIIVQVCGTPSDCAEQRTKTVHGNPYNPVFDESFEFEVSVTQMTLVRFLVLDDDCIGDDFIGQFTLPFDCIQTGYRHVNLLNSTGEKLSNSNLFVHIAITNRRGGGKKTKRGRSVKSKSKKYNCQIKKLGIPELDDNFKSIYCVIKESYELRHVLHSSVSVLRDSCNLPTFCNIKQCLRTILNTLAATNTPIAVSPTTNQSHPIAISDSNQSPSHAWTNSSSPSVLCSSTSSPSISLSVSPTSNFSGRPGASFPVMMILATDETPRLVFTPNEYVYQIPELVRSSVRYFDELMQACNNVIQVGSSLYEKIDHCRKQVLDQHDNLQSVCEQHEIKAPKKIARVAESFVWNLRLIQGQCDLLSALIQEANEYKRAARDVGVMLGLFNNNNNITNTSTTSTTGSDSYSQVSMTTSTKSSNIQQSTNHPISIPSNFTQNKTISNLSS